MKIGKLVKSYIPKIFQYCQQHDLSELERLKDKSYSNNTFGIGFPFCSTQEIASLNSKRYWKDTYKINGEVLRVSSQWTFKHTPRFLSYLQNLDLITESEFDNLGELVKASYGSQENYRDEGPVKMGIEGKVSAQEKYFNISLINEANYMSEQYKKFYCLERSIRELIRVNLEEKYGSDWWDTLDDAVKSSVEKNLKYEMDTTHTKRSEQNIDYTTFGDLRKIINSNWSKFESKFNRNLNSVNEVMIDLNRLRVPIAHCTPLAPKEIKRLEIRIDDWYDLLVK